MIAFLPLKDNVYEAVENGERVAKGRLLFEKETVLAVIEYAAADRLDFFFRALLNVCAKYKNFTVRADLPPEYLKKFNFENGRVRVEDIVFPKNCEGV